MARSRLATPSRATSSRRSRRRRSGTSGRASSCPITMHRASRPSWERRRSDPRQARRQREEEAPQDPRAHQGLPRRGELQLQAREGGLDQGRLLRVPRPPQPQARLPPPVDHAHQRRRAPERPVLRRVHPRPQAGRHRARPQGPGRHRRARSRDVPTLCRGRPRGVGSRCVATQPTPSSQGRRFQKERRPSFCPARRDAGAAIRPMITSHHNPLLKDVRRLAARKECGRFVAEGEDLLAAAREAGWNPVHLLRAGVEVSEDALAKVSTLGSGTRALGVFEERWAPAPTGPVVVCLWGVKDPGNVGTVLRAALAFGAGCVALGPGTADPYGPKAVRASMGAIFAVPVARVTTVDELPGVRVALDARRGEQLRGPAEGVISLVIGAERAGLPPDVLAACDRAAHIPIANESLNAAMAATLATYELTRVTVLERPC